ncbi:MAG: hypothetical protein IJ509_00260 [Bacilli bacterium]|nr:hypothetical protein [Bacilli bacterium]
MTLEGAINLNETTNYIVYTMNSATTGQYGVVVPKNVAGTLNMLVDLHMKGSFDGVGNGTKTKEQLVAEVSEEYEKLKTKYVDGMLVMPMIDEVMFQNTVATGDKQKMFDEVKKIGAITSELYKKLTDSGIEKQKIDQKIIIVEKNQDDEKFVAWLKEQMPNFVDGVLYSDFTKTQEMGNPFVNSTNSIFGPAQEEKPKAEETVINNGPTSTGGIFDNVAPVVTPVAPVEPVVPVAPVADSTPDVNVTPVEPIMASASVEASTNEVPNNNVDIFGIPLDVKGVQNNEVVGNNNTVVQNPVPTSTPVVEEPKPVASAPLEGTTTFSPITNPTATNNNVSDISDGSEATVKKDASKGFVNLLILLVILVGVTIASIELGKFLYSVYGA